jgi:hypothetical protein
MLKITNQQQCLPRALVIMIFKMNKIKNKITLLIILKSKLILLIKSNSDNLIKRE